MIPFFRKIRKKMADDNKPMKYARYAGGEIILVVIGILIALQINNWNEHRKVRLNESVILLSLKEELISTLQELKDDMKGQTDFEQSTRDVYSYIQNKPMLVDSMYIDFYNMISFNYFYPKTSIYQSLKSGNIEIIQSDSLKILITDIYESGYQRIISKVNTRRNAAELLFPYYKKHFNSKFLIDSISKRRTIIGIPINYEEVINDPEFETLIIEAIAGRRNFTSDYKITIKYVEDCIAKIDEYLKP